MDVKLKYKCEYCVKEYSTKYNYDRHIACCHIYNSNNNEELDVVPSIKDIYTIVKELALKVTKLEEENKRLRSYGYKQEKLNILELLNNLSGEKQPKYTLDIWINNLLSNVKLYLPNVFDTNLLTGIISLLENSINNNDGTLPIRTFSNSKNTTYIYCDDNGNNIWKQASNKDIDKEIRKICRQFIIDFKEIWYKKHEDLINEDDAINNKYVDYYTKILGGINNNDDLLYQKIRTEISKKIKEDLTNIT